MDEQSTQELDWREGDYVPIIPIIRSKRYIVKSRRMMDKMLNRYFDKVVDDEYNQQRMMSEQWLEKRAMFDSYMNPADRRRTPISNMRGYQIQRNEKRTFCSTHSKTMWSTMPKLTNNSTRSLSSL